MDSEGVQSAGGGVDGARDYVRREDMSGVGVRIAEEVGEGYGGKGVVVGEGGLKELDHRGRVVNASATQLYSTASSCWRWRWTVRREEGMWWCDDDGNLGKKGKAGWPNPGFWLDRD